MVLEIRLSNFFSIKDEVVLNMQAANIKTGAAKKLLSNTFTCGNERMLKTAAIYGEKKFHFWVHSVQIR